MWDLSGKKRILAGSKSNGHLTWLNLSNSKCGKVRQHLVRTRNDLVLLAIDPWLSGWMENVSVLGFYTGLCIFLCIPVVLYSACIRLVLYVELWSEFLIMYTGLAPWAAQLHPLPLHLPRYLPPLPMALMAPPRRCWLICRKPLLRSRLTYPLCLISTHQTIRSGVPSSPLCSESLVCSTTSTAASSENCVPAGTNRTGSSWGWGCASVWNLNTSLQCSETRQSLRWIADQRTVSAIYAWRRPGIKTYLKLPVDHQRGGPCSMHAAACMCM